MWTGQSSRSHQTETIKADTADFDSGAQQEILLQDTSITSTPNKKLLWINSSQCSTTAGCGNLAHQPTSPQAMMMPLYCMGRLSLQ